MSFDVKAVQKTFFDRKSVMSAMSRGVKKALSQFGAHTRTRAKSSLRYGKKTSAPGRPPVVHRSAGYTKVTRNKKTGAVKKQPASPLRELTFFGYDEQRESVAIGPVLKSGGGAKVLQAIEYGDAGHAARPWVTPAFQAELPNAPKGFRTR